LADRNAAGDPRWVRFLGPRQWTELNFDLIFARDWTDPDRFVYYDRKGPNARRFLCRTKSNQLISSERMLLISLHSTVYWRSDFRSQFKLTRICSFGDPEPICLRH
jgi:hypothetical protein